MNLSTRINPFFTHSIDDLCTVCHVVLKDADRTHSIFSTLEELEIPMNVLQVLQSFSNFNFYNCPQSVCTTCYYKTIEVYKFIEMCNKAHENMQHYLKNVKDVTDADVKIEEISIAPPRILIDGREFVEEMENEKICKFDKLGMAVSATEINTEEIILQDGIETDETSNKEEITIYVVTEESTDSTDSDNLKVEKMNAQMHDERTGLIKCNDCDLVFSDKQGLDDHRKQAKHTKEKPFPSETSNALIRTKYNLRSHNRRNNSQRTHLSKDLKLNQNRHQPLKDHETNVVCLKCQKVFYNYKQLKIHMRSHKKKFLCNHCGKVFTTKSFLNTHIIHVHTGAKSLTCLICKRTFVAPSYLLRHMDSHHGIKPHKCEQCDRRFTQASNLHTHMKIHNGVKAHICEQCDRRFTMALSLRRHMIAYH